MGDGKFSKLEKARSDISSRLDLAQEDFELLEKARQAIIDARLKLDTSQQQLDQIHANAERIMAELANFDGAFDQKQQIALIQSLSLLTFVLATAKPEETFFRRVYRKFREESLSGQITIIATLVTALIGLWTALGFMVKHFPEALKYITG